MSTGQIGILNVGAGDTKITFDPSNPAETIRSGRMIIDMLRRGYALLIEVTDAKGEKAYQRVTEFRENTGEYIVADFDSAVGARQDGKNHERDGDTQSATTAPDGAGDGEAGAQAPKLKAGGKRGAATRAILASTTTGIAVARSAGG
jgi:hypothetical protein